jgi:hypothetical protein
VEAKEPLTAALGASVTGRIAGGKTVKTQSPTLPYQKQQEELGRHRKMLENSKDFTFINLMLRSLGLGEKK